MKKPTLLPAQLLSINGCSLKGISLMFFRISPARIVKALTGASLLADKLSCGSDRLCAEGLIDGYKPPLQKQNLNLNKKQDENPVPGKTWKNNAQSIAPTNS